MRAIALFVPAVIASTALAGGITYDEAIDGDLSDDRFNPTFLSFTEGVNRVTMDVIISDQPGGDRDYFTFTIDPGFILESVILVDASNPAGGFDSTAFVGFTGGDIFGFDPDTFQGDLYGFELTSSEFVGTDILPSLTSEDGSAPSPAGDYTVWVQQTGADLTSITLDFIVTPAPSSVAIALPVLLVSHRRRRGPARG